MPTLGQFEAKALLQVVDVAVELLLLVVAVGQQLEPLGPS